MGVFGDDIRPEAVMSYDRGRVGTRVFDRFKGVSFN